eukprot:5583773-Prymnesium_polylepis.1
MNGRAEVEYLQDERSDRTPRYEEPVRSVVITTQLAQCESYDLCSATSYTGSASGVHCHSWSSPRTTTKSDNKTTDTNVGRTHCQGFNPTAREDEFDSHDTELPAFCGPDCITGGGT